MGKYTLWTLNRVAKWDFDVLTAELAVTSMFSQKHDITLGSRAASDVDQVLSKPGVLSHEEPLWDEYFVPIPVKCIGDPRGGLERLGPRFSGGGGKAAATELLAGFPQYFQQNGESSWQKYWTLTGTTGMFTKPGAAGAVGYKGFYELLVEAADKTGPAVLIGYSQGGLVARFLAYLDELLMPPDRRCVAGVITVQAPNHGSPLANRDVANVASVSDGLFSILTGVAGFPITPVDGLLGARNAATSAVLRAIVRGAPAANGLQADLRILAELFQAGVDDARANKKPDNFPATARKWLSGLLPQPIATAFCDLDPMNLDKASTVLGRVHRSPLAETWHGAVIGTDNKIDDFVAAGKSFLLRFAIKHAPDWLGIGPTLSTSSRRPTATFAWTRPCPTHSWALLSHKWPRRTGAEGMSSARAPALLCCLPSRMTSSSRPSRRRCTCSTVRAAHGPRGFWETASMLAAPISVAGSRQTRIQMSLLCEACCAHSVRSSHRSPL